MTFRGPGQQEVTGKCWCGGDKITTTYAPDDIIEHCGEDIFHNPAGPPPQYVRVEVEEGRAYTYQAFEEPPLERGEWVLLPGNQVHTKPFPGQVIRLLDGPDRHYDGPYKAVVRRLL